MRARVTAHRTKTNKIDFFALFYHRTKKFGPSKIIFACPLSENNPGSAHARTPHETNQSNDRTLIKVRMAATEKANKPTHREEKRGEIREWLQNMQPFGSKVFHHLSLKRRHLLS